MGQYKVHLEGVDIFTGRPHVGLYGCFMKSRNVIIPTIKETTLLVHLVHYFTSGTTCIQ
jgi:hypothetical protein